jgi:hypothetical protein
MTDPILVAVTAAIAGSATGAVLDVVKGKLTSRRAAKLLAKASANISLSDRETAWLRKELVKASVSDPSFAVALRDAWDRDQQHISRGNQSNQVHESVARSVIQARDIKGDITLN